MSDKRFSSAPLQEAQTARCRIGQDEQSEVASKKSMWAMARKCPKKCGAVAACSKTAMSYDL